MIQQNYFSDLYPPKILDLSTKPFFPCTHHESNSLCCFNGSINSRIYNWKKYHNNIVLRL